MFTRDEGTNSVNETRANLNAVHPFYLCMEPDGNAHGVFFLNSNAQEVTLGPAPSLVYRTIGGQLDLFFFPGPKPEDVIQQYLTLIGFPAMPAYWALGYQQSRWGYKNISQIQAAQNRTQSHNIPFDIQVFDIDYLDRRKQFTYDHVNFAGMPQFVMNMQASGMRVITITDLGKFSL